MKKLVLTSVLAVFAMSGVATADVKNSLHDLSNMAASNNICIYCHTPHSALNSNAPLWNRNLPGGPFTLYSSDTIDMTINAPRGVTLACLSCHDGSIALDAFGGSAGAGNFITAARQIGPDLSAEHPVSVDYDPTQDVGKFNTQASAETAGLNFYGGAGGDDLECATCHNPHDTTNGMLLRISNVASALCLTCHNI